MVIKVEPAQNEVINPVSTVNKISLVIIASILAEGYGLRRMINQIGQDVQAAVLTIGTPSIDRRTDCMPVACSSAQQRSAHLHGPAEFEDT